MLKNSLSLFFLLSLVFVACKHEPFPAPPPGMPNDTTKGKPCDPDTVYYRKYIQPILNTNCAYSGCHDAATASKDVNLSDYEAVISTADVRPFNADGSDIYEVLIETDLDKRMPLGQNQLPQNQIDLIRKWINQGALNLSCDECDTTNLTYANGIKTIFENNCVSCHGSTNPSANLSLTTYEQVRDAILNTNLQARINAEPGVPLMPQGGKMPQCNIDKIETWVANGFPQ